MKSACGEYTHGDLLNKAMDLSRDKYGVCEWPKVSEECFREAFGILFNKPLTMGGVFLKIKIERYSNLS